MFLIRRVLVGDREHALIVRRGRFDQILSPGAYWIFGLGVEVEKFATGAGNEWFFSRWTDFLVKERPAIVEKFFAVVETGDAEMAAVFFDGKLGRPVGPGSRLLFWRGASTVTAEVYNTKVNPEVPAALVGPLARFGKDAQITRIEVAAGTAGLLYFDGRFVRTLDPGVYAFWNVAGSVKVELIDLRLQTIEIPGQEILTRDKVSIRVNIAVEFRVDDPALAAAAVNGWAAHLYRAAQFAVRQALGLRTLDEVLADKVGVEQARETLGEVRAAMEPLGVKVNRIALKDIILPGEMRDILNQVVLAEKQAQANLIRRREETAATRSILNTARLMQENPLVVRLKELETLEKVAEKVEKISIYSGVEGLLQNLVSLRQPE